MKEYRCYASQLASAFPRVARTILATTRSSYLSSQPALLLHQASPTWSNKSLLLENSLFLTSIP